VHPLPGKSIGKAPSLLIVDLTHPLEWFLLRLYQRPLPRQISPRVLQRSQRIRQLAAQRRYQRREHVTLRRAFLSGTFGHYKQASPHTAKRSRTGTRHQLPAVDFVRAKQNQERPCHAERVPQTNETRHYHLRGYCQPSR
jgi:hypothetical protein